jgi:hypothetical protein
MVQICTRVRVSYGSTRNSGSGSVAKLLTRDGNNGANLHPRPRILRVHKKQWQRISSQTAHARRGAAHRGEYRQAAGLRSGPAHPQFCCYCGCATARLRPAVSDW